MIYSGLPARKRRERALEALQMVEMENRARHRPMQLSGDSSSAPPSPARWSIIPRSFSPTNPPATSIRTPAK